MKERQPIPFWRDRRVLGILAQILVLAIVISAIAFLGNNLVTNFQRLRLNFSFNFLSRAASFSIGNSPLAFRPTDPYSKAILVGLINSLRVMFLGIILASILGMTIGIARLTDNWLVKKLAAVYVEIFRNTPLLLQLFFWYFAVFLRFPKINDPLILGERLFFTNRGAYLPWLEFNTQTGFSLSLIALSLVCGIWLWQQRIKVIEETGNASQFWLWGLGAIAVSIIVIFCFGLVWIIPQYTGNSIVGGLNLSPELATLTLGLSLYTAAFIAEVVRAGIQSVNKGQWEAARALGLQPSLVMQLIIFPQALRVMIPPLTSEFLNLAKNSSLATAIGYSDIYAIANTISNQTGRSIEMLIVVMTTYLIINLIIATIMNWFNRSVQLKER